MAFDVYPASHTDPLTVASGATEEEPITPHFAVDVAVTRMWIRVTMLGSGCAPSGAVAPTFSLRAGTGTAVSIPAAPDIASINDGTNFANALVQAESDDVYRIEVFMQASVTPHPDWWLSIMNNDGVAHDFVWVVASTDAEAEQPWLHATDTLDYDVLVGQSGAPTANTLRVENRGTGVLTLSDAPGTDLGSGFTLDGYAELGGAPLAPPIEILPNHCVYLVVNFEASPAPGQTSETYAVGSNDAFAVAGSPGHNDEVAMAATTARLEVALLLDGSGSMDERPDGTSTGVFEQQRWGLLYDAVEEFFVLLVDIGTSLGEDVGAFGVAVFNNNNAETIEGAEKTPFTDSGTITDVLDALRNRAPLGGTPMGEGIEHVLGPISNVSNFFEMDAASMNFNRRWMVLMSDGAHNQGTHPSTFLGGGSNTFQSKNVRAFTIAYGDVGAYEVDHALLADIAAGSDGQAQVADTDDAFFAVALKKAFRDALITGLSLDPVFDPEGVLTPSNPEVRQTIGITHYDKTASFIVNWETFSEERVSVQLLTPLCEVITPGVAQDTPGITFHRGTRSGIYTFDRSFLQNDEDPDRPRVGAWTLIISSNTDDESERYAYDTIVDSDLRLRVDLGKAKHYAGDTLDLTARLTVNGVPLPNASVTLTLTRPGQSVTNWLAFTPVSQRAFNAAQERLGVDTSFFAIKAHVLNQQGLGFNGYASQSTIPLTDDANEGVYRASVSNTTVTGRYTLRITAVGETADGVAFRRERALNLYLDVRPAPEFTLVDVLYGTLAGANVLTAQVNVTLRDAFGNVLLVDPTTSPLIDLSAEGGEFAGPLQPNLDGTYSRTLHYQPGARPVLSLSVGGVQVVPPQPLAPVQALNYAGEVVAFELGGEAEPGINQHRDPQAALGDVTAKPPDVFVSLGAAGSLAVGAKDQAILPDPKHGDDIVVFVRPDTEHRSYTVEALPVGRRDAWVHVGASAGITQGFSLASAGLKAAQAVRVTDTSGRIFDGSFKPTATPGVSIRGVGFARVGSYEEVPDEPGGPSGCLGMVLGLIFGGIAGVLRGITRRSDTTAPTHRT